jgi:hypothetical protein
MLPLDPHVVDALLPDLVGHDKRPSSFVLYLWLYSMTKGVGRKSAFFSYQMLTDRTGLSKVVRKSATAVPEYAVATPWIHAETSGGRR